MKVSGLLMLASVTSCAQNRTGVNVNLQTTAEPVKRI
jgi:hypothetical protein